VGAGWAAGGEREDAFGGDGILAEHVGGEVDAAAVGVFFDVAKDVGELESDAGVDGELVGAAVGVAEDADADEADDGCDEVAIVSSVRRHYRRFGSCGDRWALGISSVWTPSGWGWRSRVVPETSCSRRSSEMAKRC
jgi:hypothetical protein